MCGHFRGSLFEVDSHQDEQIFLCRISVLFQLPGVDHGSLGVMDRAGSVVQDKSHTSGELLNFPEDFSELTQQQPAAYRRHPLSLVLRIDVHREPSELLVKTEASWIRVAPMSINLEIQIPVIPAYSLLHQDLRPGGSKKSEALACDLRTSDLPMWTHGIRGLTALTLRSSRS